MSNDVTFDFLATKAGQKTSTRDALIERFEACVGQSVFKATTSGNHQVNQWLSIANLIRKDLQLFHGFTRELLGVVDQQQNTGSAFFVRLEIIDQVEPHFTFVTTAIVQLKFEQNVL